MNARRAGRLLSRLLVGAETKSTRVASHLSSQTRSLAACSRSVSAWQRAAGPWQHWRHINAQQARACAKTAATTQSEEQSGEAQDGEEFDSHNIGEAIVRLEAEAMELAAEGEPERCPAPFITCVLRACSMFTLHAFHEPCVQCPSIYPLVFIDSLSSWRAV